MDVHLASQSKNDCEILETVPAHLVYLVLSAFLIVYALFSEYIRNRLHLSEPPLATLVGIAYGHLALDVLHVPQAGQWHRSDRLVQEITRIIVGIQCFTVGIELPPGYLTRHRRSLSLLVGPNMITGWFVATLIVWLVLGVQFSTALIIAACLTPTDPVLSEAVLAETKFSQRIPKRLKQLLAAESGCNDGSACPLLYAAIFAVTKLPVSETGTASAIKSWFIEVLLWDCGVAILLGTLLGYAGNRSLRLSEEHNFVVESNLLAYSVLLATLMVGLGSTLGVDVFLMSFAAGAAFGWDGWFAIRTKNLHLQSIVDLVLNSAMFVYFGTIIPWGEYTGQLSLGRMLAVTLLVLLLKRIPVLLALRPFIRDFHTWGEALFAGHFGPIGIGALFLAVEARGQLERGESTPFPSPPKHGDHKEVVDMLWPVVSFIVLGSIIIHGLSTLAMSGFRSLMSSKGVDALFHSTDATGNGEGMSLLINPQVGFGDDSCDEDG